MSSSKQPLNKKYSISAIILAAGESKRMGQPKQLMRLGKKTIVEHVVDNVLASKASEVIVVTGHQAAEVRQAIGVRPVKIVFDAGYKQGMSTAIVAGVKQVDPSSAGMMLVLGDLPFVDSGVIDRLMAQFANQEKGIAVPAYGGRRGHPVIFGIKYRDILLGLCGDVGAREIIKQYPEDVLEIEVDSDSIVIDIDTPEDYQANISYMY